MWDNGDSINRQVLMAFGDTYGYCGVRGQQWRYNTLFRSQDGSLAKTISVPNGAVSNRYSGSPVWAPGLSKQIINSIKWAPTEKGIIPTAGISVGRTQYVNFMSIKNWDSDGRWTTNFSAIAVSPDTGENWGVYPGTVRALAPDSIAGVPYVPGNENFQQGAFLRPGPGDPYLYSFGTPSGRGGPAFCRGSPRVSFRTSPSTSIGAPLRTPGSRIIRRPPRRSSRARWEKCRPNTTRISSNTWCFTATVPTTSWQGVRRLRKDRGVQSNCSCRQCSSPAASTRHISIPGRRAKSCTSICRYGPHTT